MFTVQPLSERRLIMVKFSRAFWDEAVVDRFISDCVRAALSIGGEAGTHRTLVDLRNASLQSQVVVARLQRFMADPRAGRIALVATTPLERMQTRRLAVRDDIRMFDDIEQAVAWLEAPDSRQKAA